MNSRIHAVVEAKGGTIQSYLQNAALEALGKDEKAIREEEEYRRRKKLERRPRERAPATPSGMGLRERLAAETERRAATAAEEHEAPSAPPVQVVITTAPAPAGPGTDVAQLAAYVVSGAKWERNTKRKVALDILHTTAKTAEERAARTEALDAEIAKLADAAKPTDLFERIKRGFFE